MTGVLAFLQSRKIVEDGNAAKMYWTKNWNNEMERFS